MRIFPREPQPLIIAPSISPFFKPLYLDPANSCVTFIELVLFYVLESKFIEAFTALTDELVILFDLRLLLNVWPLIKPSSSRGLLVYDV